MLCCCHVSVKVLGVASCILIVNFVTNSPSCMISFCVFMVANSNSFFNLKRNLYLPLKYPQVHWELCFWGKCSHSQAKFHWLFFLFCFRTWFHWGWGVKLSPKIWDCSWYDTSRRLTAPDIFIDFYELKYLWICHFSVFCFFSFCLFLPYFMLVFAS